jgi:hypothetical protein
MKLGRSPLSKYVTETAQPPGATPVVKNNEELLLVIFPNEYVLLMPLPFVLLYGGETKQ